MLVVQLQQDIIQTSHVIVGSPGLELAQNTVWLVVTVVVVTRSLEVKLLRGTIIILSGLSLEMMVIVVISHRVRVSTQIRSHSRTRGSTSGHSIGRTQCLSCSVSTRSARGKPITSLRIRVIGKCLTAAISITGIPTEFNSGHRGGARGSTINIIESSGGKVRS